MYAAKGGNTAVVSKLLELGCDVGIVNNEGMSAMQVCVAAAQSAPKALSNR